ncbi:hypothetical protein TWF788_003250 [Orbilia oligospora]|uniref:Uncharacterized protein n=1 Tax=Orbilia oligospora TaxID=2813651 RepID=A0A7C8PZW1_ORBOL|nr:hypothetical protein TWF788_003250 [Orbilia oligospora]
MLKGQEAEHADLINEFREQAEAFRTNFDIDLVPTDLIDTVMCHLCRADIPLYENLEPMDRLRCTVAIGTRGAADEKVPFAGLTVGGRCVSRAPQYLPWGNYRFYVEAIKPIPPDQRHLIPPLYDIRRKLLKDDPRNPPNAICLRTNRERLCELPYLGIVKKALQNGSLIEFWPKILEFYLFADITNVIAYESPTGTLLYIQARVNCGGLAWFGYREFRNYIQDIRPSVIDWRMFSDCLQSFSDYHLGNDDFDHMYMFYSVVIDIKDFEGKAETLSIRSEDPEVEPVLRQLRAENKYGRAKEEWRLEDQAESRPDWKDEKHELEPPEE